MRPVIISSLITGGSEGGGGHTRESIMSSVTRIMPPRSGGSVRDELKKQIIKEKSLKIKTCSFRSKITFELNKEKKSERIKLTASSCLMTVPLAVHSPDTSYLDRIQ